MRYLNQQQGGMMTALRRLFVTFATVAGAATLALAAGPATAQSADAPVDVTAAPPPSADSVGPAQLRNFFLGGNSSRPTSPSTTGTVSPPRPVASSPVASPPQTEAVRNDPVRHAPSAVNGAAPSSRSVASTVPESPTHAVTTDPTENELTVPSGPAEVAPAVQNEPTPSFPTGYSTPSNPGAISLWPWLAAALALAGGAAVLWWMRRQRRDRYNDPGRLAFAGPQPEDDAVSQPHPPAPARAPVPTPPPAPVPAPAPAPSRDDGMIVSRRLLPALRMEFQPDRLLVNDKEVAIQFDVVIANDGAAPARDVLVKAALFTAHAGQDEQIAGFFRDGAGDGDRIAAIAPLGRIALKSIVRLPIDQVQRFTVEDRELFVPLVAFNIFYRCSTGEEKSSASFLVGRGTGDSAKLAPFLIEVGPKIINGLSSRPHSNGLSR